MLTSHKWGTVVFTWDQFHYGSPGYCILYNEFENYIFKLQPYLPGVNKLDTFIKQYNYLVVIFSSQSAMKF